MSHWVSITISTAARDLLFVCVRTCMGVWVLCVSVSACMHASELGERLGKAARAFGYLRSVIFDNRSLSVILRGALCACMGVTDYQHWPAEKEILLNYQVQIFFCLLQ